MQEIFYPSSVAVIGVSSKPDNLGRNIVANLIEYEFNGIVYAVGPSEGTIETRRIYRSVVEIPDPVDLAVIFTPAQTVSGVLEECGRKGIRWAIIETAGFREFGVQGRQLEDEIVRVAAEYGIRFVGPNCIGAINMENGFCVPFPLLKKFIKPGEVSIVTQSGGVGMSVLNLLANEGLGLNKFVSVGNVLNIDAEDMLEYLVGDERTGLIFVYLESITNGRRLMDIARCSTKPILIFKSNIGKLGHGIALSHTASLTSDDKVVDAALHQVGVVRVHDATSLGNSLKILRLPPMMGKNLAIISRSGGHAVIAADACELSGFNLAQLPEAFLREIEKNFRASVIRLTNPLDLGDLFDLNVYATIVEQTLQLEGIDGVVFLQTALSEMENLNSRCLLERIMELVKQYGKPVAYFIATAAQEVGYLKQNYDFPVFTQVVETVRALQMSYYYYSQSQQVHAPKEELVFEVDRAKVKRHIETAKAEQRSLLLDEALEVLECYEIPTVRGELAESVDEARAIAEKIGYPVVIKIVAEQISHKSDVGGVQLNLRNSQAVAEAFEYMMSRIHKAYPHVKVDGVLVQPMITGGHELILGGRQDAQFGPVVMVGLGGIFVEVLDEVTLRVAPISRREAQEMVESLRGYPILKGTRGHTPSDIDSVVEVLLRLSCLLIDFPEIQELDINPLRIFHEKAGCCALDARIILGE
jgi:acyl-CoA synthetase (NDP forming)